MSVPHMSDDRGITTVSGDVVVVEGESVSGTHTRTKVVVVGAGIAGVTAAAKLIHNGIQDVVVLEAQDYIGGRIKATVVGDETLDMGAMFVHGQVGNPIYEIVERLGVEAADIDEVPTFYYTSKGEKISPKEVETIMDFFENEKAQETEVGKSTWDVVDNLYNQLLQENQIYTDHPKRELYDTVLRLFHFLECTENSCRDLSEVGAWWDSKYVSHSGKKHTTIKGGYSMVMHSLVDLIPKEVIRCGTLVLSIDWTSQQDGGILVRCVNGDVFSADHVIITISMGCLKAVQDSMFTPSLPASFLNSIGKVEFGYIGKIFLKWDTPFWNKEEGVSYNFLWLESEHPVTLKQDKSKRKTRFGKPWWHNNTICHSVNDGGDFLLFWLLRHQMDAIADLDNQEVLGVLHELMQTFVADVDIPMPSAMYKTNWEHNPYIRGTYTYGIPSFDSSDGENLNRPVFPSTQNPRLLFAGEAFVIEHMTTAHGAFITGEEQAERVLKANGITELIRVADTISYER